MARPEKLAVEIRSGRYGLAPEATGARTLAVEADLTLVEAPS